MAKDDDKEKSVEKAIHADHQHLKKIDLMVFYATLLRW